MTKAIELQSPECEKLAERIYTLAMRFFLSHPEFKMRRGCLYQTVKQGDVVDHCCCGAGAAWLQADGDKEESERTGSKLILGSTGGGSRRVIVLTFSTKVAGRASTTTSTTRSTLAS